MKTLIIAEAGVNHNGDMAKAFQLVDVAADSGADYVKFQTFKADLLVTRDAGKAEYQKENTEAHESQYDMLKKLELTREMHEELIAHCKKRGILFLSTGFDIKDIDLLIELGVDRIKIPSGEITNLPYLRYVGSLKKPIILSTGMATMEEVQAALVVLETAGTPRSKITVLHCTTEYPTPLLHVNLKAMLAIRDTCGVEVGYSDHTTGIEVAIAAVAMGAVIIEKHFTLDRQLPGPDHKASLEPSELQAMVTAIRNIELAKGDGIKCPSFGEIQNKSIVRKSIVAACFIKKGERFTEENITTKRPGTGISPMNWDEILGLTALCDYQKNEMINL